MPTRPSRLRHDAYGRPISPRFTSMADYLDYVDSLTPSEVTPQTVKEAADVRARPGRYEIGPGGNLAVKPDWLARNLPWLGPAAVGGGIFAAAGGPAALFGGGGAPSGGLSSVSAGPVTGYTAGGYVSPYAAAGGAGGGGGGGGAGAGGGLFGLGRKATAGLLGADWGINLFNNWMSSRAQNRTTEAQLDLANRRLAFQTGPEFDFQKSQWADQYAAELARLGIAQNQFADTQGLARSEFQQTQANRAPYQAAGVGALSALSRGLGTGGEIRPVSQVELPPPSPRIPLPTRAGAQPFGPPMTAPVAGGASSLLAPGSASVDAAAATVTLRAPDGTVKDVPSAHVPWYLSRGATRMTATA